MSQDMIEEKINGEADRVTIYRVLNRLCKDGIAHKVTSDMGKSYYALCKSCDGDQHTHDHFHFKCLDCEKVECLNEPITLTLPKGYQLESMNCWVSGHCDQCSAARRSLRADGQ